ncbi:MAG: DUF3180 domain-containing protein [Dermatophilaceae bacterium]
MVTARGIRPRTLVAIALTVGVPAVMLLRLTGGALGPLSPGGWAGVVVLVFMAAGVVAAGLPVQRLRDGKSATPISPLRAARTLVLAQSSALAGAALCGWYAAHAVALVPDLDVDSQKARLWLVLTHIVAAVVLGLAGMITQRRCRLDDRPPREDVA